MNNGSVQNRKEAINEYKRTLQPMGIYQIRNLADRKVFIDSSKNLNGSLNSSKFQLVLGSYRNRALQADFNRLGEGQFAFGIMDQLEPKKDDPAYDYTEDLATLKSMWLDKLKPFNEKGYNTPPKLT